MCIIGSKCNDIAGERRELAQDRYQEDEMMGILLSDAAAADAAAAGSSAGSLLMMVVVYAVIIGAMWFFLFRPQKKEQKRVAAMIASLENGDYVLTTSGFYGVVIDINDDTVIVEFGNNKNCRIPMEKSAISRVEKTTEA